MANHKKRPLQGEPPSPTDPQGSYTGQPLEVICRDTERDNFLTAQQALDYGLIDAVIEKR